MSIIQPNAALRPMVMGVVNTTPDSFFDGGKYSQLDLAFEQAQKLISEGAHIIDIGGESTRPGAKEIDNATEIARTIPLIEKIRAIFDVMISIDTRKPQVARAAIAAGANIWNDVSALTFAEDSISTAVELNVPVVLMHFQGIPENMQDNPKYFDVVTEILSFLSARMGMAIAAGVKRENIILDMGIGFGKTLEHNLEIIANLQKFTALGRPILLGASRKSLIGKIDESASDPLDRLGGSLALALIGADKGASIIRVHDVKETMQALKVRAAVLGQRV